MRESASAAVFVLLLASCGGGAIGDGGGNRDGGSGDGGTGGNGDSGTGDGGGGPTVDAAPPPPPGTAIEDRLTTKTITVSDGVNAGDRNWRIWGTGSLGVAPVFTAPLSNCQTLVCYSAAAGPRVVRLSADGTLVETHNLAAGLECRGLAAQPSGEFAALLWDDTADRIYVYRYGANGIEVGNTELVNATNKPDDFGIGDSRFEYGDGKYGAYYHVHSDSGHEGDTLKWVTTAGVESTGWNWGCSHSMSAALRYNASDNKFMPACVTDCYPGTSGSDFATSSIGGIYTNHNRGHVMDVNAGCNGSVAAEIGSAAVASSGWMLSYNAHRAPATMGQGSYNPSTMNQDVGVARIGADYMPGTVMWLTDTPSVDEADTTIALWTPDGDDTEQYLVGWSEPGSNYVYKMARINASGGFIEGPTDVSSLAGWGRRDDPMRRHYDGDVVWAWFDGPGSTTLHFARIESGRAYQCTP